MVKTYMKKVTELSKTDKEQAQKLLPAAYKILDTAAKKHILHKNNISRKKSLLARVIANGGPVGASNAVIVAKAKKAERAEKKAAVKR